MSFSAIKTRVMTDPLGYLLALATLCMVVADIIYMLLPASVKNDTSTATLRTLWIYSVCILVFYWVFSHAAVVSTRGHNALNLAHAAGL